VDDLLFVVRFSSRVFVQQTVVVVGGRESLAEATPLRYPGQRARNAGNEK